MQRLLLRAIAEASDAGLTQVVLVLAPGTIDDLYRPIDEALRLASVPCISLEYVEQVKPVGLGDAVLRAEAMAGNQLFAVLLPDDVVSRSEGHSKRTSDLRRMIEASKRIGSGHMLAVTSVPTSKLSQGGVAMLGKKEVGPGVFPVERLFEKPEAKKTIFKAGRAEGIVGRYVLMPSVFGALHHVKAAHPDLLQLTDAIELLRDAGEAIFAFQIRAGRRDIGEALHRAGHLVENH
jgi:UTP--glucose-1-phosphate uridylyltransferase